MNAEIFYLTKYTRPYFPFPSYFSRVKSSKVTFLGFGFADQGIYLEKVRSLAKLALFDSKVGSTI